MITSSARAYRDSRSRQNPGPDPVEELARTRFGVTYLYPIQRFVVSNVLEGRPQIVVLPTGAGKSLCFQLPSLLLPGPTLVLMPLLSLLSDQLRKMNDAGIPVAELRGELAPAEKDQLFAGIAQGSVRILLATPEACLVPATAERLKACRFAHFVVDEAHCVSEWGESFRPAYREVGVLARRLGVSMISAFTATASKEVIDKIKVLLFDDAEVRIVAGSPDRPEISYAVLPVLSRAHALAGIVRTVERPLLVFCRTRGGTEVAARSVLRTWRDGQARFYHAGLTREERGNVEQWFLSSREGALFATCAYGLGVDKPDIRTVVHADVPASVEAYLQESGRAGRDRKPSRAILLVSREDETFRSQLTDPVARQRYEKMLSYAQGVGECRRTGLLSLIGQTGVACSGCDMCDGTATEAPEGAREILWFARRHRRRFSVGEAAQILSAAPGPRAARGFHDCIPGYARLLGWENEHVESAIRELAAAGSVRVHARGPWKGRLTVGH